jgi:hypothetical protein
MIINFIDEVTILKSFYCMLFRFIFPFNSFIFLKITLIITIKIKIQVKIS